jgi:hypothetical protein
MMGARLRFALPQSVRLFCESISVDESVPIRTRQRARALLLLDEGLSVKSVAHEVGVHRKTIWMWARSYLRDGVQGLFSEKSSKSARRGDRRKSGSQTTD